MRPSCSGRGAHSCHLPAIGRIDAQIAAARIISISGWIEVSVVKRLVVILTILVCGFLAFVFLRPDNPQTTGKLKCEFAIEHVTNYEISLTEVSNGDIYGDVFNGTAIIRFNRSGQNYIAECIFVDGSLQRLSINGKILAGS